MARKNYLLAGVAALAVAVTATAAIRAIGHPDVEAAAISVSSLPAATVQLDPSEPVINVKVDPAQIARDALTDEEFYYKLLTGGGMEPNGKGWHVIVPEHAATAPSGSIFPSIYNYDAPNGMPFYLVEGAVGNDYYPDGYTRNGGGTANLEKQAGVSFYRPFTNRIATYSQSANPSGGVDVFADFSARTLDYLATYFGPKSSGQTYYIDWFGVRRLTGVAPTQRRIALVSNGKAYSIVDVDALLIEHANNPLVTLQRQVADDVDQAVATLLVTGS